MKRTTAIAMAACTALLSMGYDLIPMPRQIRQTGAERVAPASIEARIGQGPQRSEGYRLSITPEAISIEAADSAGLAWARRTLEQLAGDDGAYPQVEIADWPEFAIRGFMYDTGRNFVEVELIEEMIDLCSRYKLNAFHWHLTDKPAWRIECRAYPELNDPRHQRIGREAGRFYTYADIRRVYEYARQRGVMIIPEIDMPGHSDYFTAAFGVPMNSPRGMEILDRCLDEFFGEFSAEEMPLIHIGSDEIHIDNPVEFMDWAVKKVESAGRTPIVWDPGLDGGPGAICQIWRDGQASPDECGGGRKILDSYMGYLNYVDPMTMPNRLFLHAPCATGRGSQDELGGILCMWNDVRVIDDSRLALHNGMMGGVLPFAERFWLGGKPAEPFRGVLREAGDSDMRRLMEFQDRMSAHKVRLLPAHLAYWQPCSPAVEWDLQLLDSAGAVAHSCKAYGDAVDLDAIANQAGIGDAAQAVLSRQITAESDTVVYCRIGFDAPARSNRLGDGIAQQGKWENYGQVLVNGEEILPPVWQQPGLYQYHYNTWARPEEELPYTDEQLYWTRQPVAIPLRKGANDVRLSTRNHFPGQHFQAAFLISDPGE